MIVTHSPKSKAYQKKMRDRHNDRALKRISENEISKKNHRNPHDPAKFIKTIAVMSDVGSADHTFAKIDPSAIEEESRFDGFYAAAPDLEGTVEEITAINKRRLQIKMPVARHTQENRPDRCTA